MSRRQRDKAKADNVFLKAAKNDDYALVKMLFHDDDKLFFTNPIPDINFADANGFTALHFAAINGDYDLYDFLLKRGADPHIKNKKHQSADDLTKMFPNKSRRGERTPLQFAIFKRDEAMLDILLDATVDLNKKGKMSNSPLIMALLNCREEIAIKLINAGASFETKSDYKKTPLMLAASYNLPEVAMLLMEKGHDVTILDGEGLTAFDHAALMIINSKDPVKKTQMREVLAEMLRRNNPGISDDEIEHQRKLSLAKVLLKLSYSEDGLGLLYSAKVVKIILEILPNLKISDERKSGLNYILSMICNESSVTLENGTAFIAQSNVIGHRSYFMIEEKKVGGNWVLHYVDAGRFVHKKDHPYEDLAVSKFEINGAKFPKLGDLKIALGKIINIPRVDDREQWFVSADSGIEKDDIKLLETYLPTKQQYRGNCCLKSLLLLIRVIEEVLSDKKTELVDGKPAGDGYERHKELKDAITEYCVELVAEMADPKNADKSFYQEADDLLREVILPNAQRKMGEGHELHAIKLAQNITKVLHDKCGMGADLSRSAAPGQSIRDATLTVMSGQTISEMVM